ncbi:phage tail protein [Aeromonas dhakensis]|uniref:phage tail-collar fiber domain-containing protein n=1 Tax=Aeromonas dhakensis TaxID=196024 RepID=UPI00259E8990|nr:phage tail protein [Aeromonas dhakensis]MDM5056419.1 phage tail protein [Aeromonas dhakensis]MDM5082467.1 phage tail protein [Aeromonas dhakensis]
MSQVITNAFEQYWQSCLAAEKPVVLDEFILADIPNLDITSPIDPETGLPPESQIVHRQNVDQRGRINNNAVAYTIVMDTTVGDFSFNAMYLRNKQNGVIGMIVYKGRETKLKTDQTTGQTGNSLVKSMLMGYDQAAEATLTHVDAGTWQIDYAARLRGMDEDLRQLASQLYGHHTFIGDGFKVVEKDGAYQVTQGVAIIGGLRVELKAPEVIHPGTKPIGVWVDVHRAGSLLSEHQSHFTIITSVADLADHVDSNGYQHYVAKLGVLDNQGEVTDSREVIQNSGNLGETRHLWARSLAEAGYHLVDGSFESGAFLAKRNDAVLFESNGKCFVWAGEFPSNGIVIPKKSTPESTGGASWRYVDDSLRGELLAGPIVERNGDIALRDIISIHEFGVVFDNVTDNTERLTEAFTSGKRVIVPDPGKGNYAMISDTVKIGNGTIVVGPGRDKLVIKAMPSMDGAKDCIATSVYKGPQLAYDDYVHILGLGIHANGLNRTKAGEGEWGRGIRFGAARRSSIQSCKIVQPLQHGVDITNYDDDDIAIGHSGIPIGMSSDIFVHDVVVVDPLYDDGITTHYCHDVSIKRCTTIITDETKAVHEFQVNSKGVEVDDGSYDILVEDCNSYCNNTKVTAFSVSTHANAPAAYNIKFKNCRAYGTRCLINAWSDKNTDAHHGTSDWKSRNIVFEGISGEKGWFDKDNPIFPNRIVEVSGFVDVEVNDITFSVSGKDGSYDAPVSVINLADAIDVKMRNIKITGVPHIPVVEPTAARTVGWIRVSGNSSNIELDGFKINALGWFNRIISDSASNAFTSVKNVTVNDSPLDGQEKIAIVSGSNKLKTRNIKVPAGILPYAIGSSFKNYADGDYNLNQTVNDVTVGGYRIESHTLPDGSQAKSGLMFDNQFSSHDLQAGKGNIAFRTSDDKQTSFTICAYHSDRNTYVPVLRLQDTTGARSIEAGIDDTTYLGRNASRFKTGYFSSNIIVTSDEREKTRPFEIDDKALDAWGSVNIIIYQWIDSVITKGDDVARWHYGVIAQQVRDAFASFGIDGIRYGLLCYDEWKDEYKPIYETIELDDGSFAQVDTGKKIQTQIAGNRWGIRPDQCFWIEAAYQRRQMKRLESRIAMLEKAG